MLFRSFTQSIDYQPVNMIHVMQDIQSFQRTSSPKIHLSGKFTAQNDREKRYCAAVIHFLRVVSKMYFGERQGDKAGLPPPVLLLNGYGSHMFDKIPVVITNYSYTFEENMDTVTAILPGGGTMKFPPLFTISIEVAVQQTLRDARMNFDLSKFRTGQQMTGWI